MAQIDDIYDLLDVIDATISELSNDKRTDIDVTELPDFCLAVNEILEHDRTAYNDISMRLGINSATLNKFLKFRGTVKIRAARTLADRLRSYVRSLDQATPDRPPPVRQSEEERKLATVTVLRAATNADIPPLTFAAEQWILLHVSSEMKIKINAITALLDSIIHQVQRTNNPPDKQVLTELERKQLIAILETALAVLKSPIVEKGLLKQAKDILTRAAASAAEKQMQEGLGNAASAAAQLLWEVMKGIFK